MDTSESPSSALERRESGQRDEEREKKTSGEDVLSSFEMEEAESSGHVVGIGDGSGGGDKESESIRENCEKPEFSSLSEEARVESAEQGSERDSATPGVREREGEREGDGEKMDAISSARAEDFDEEEVLEDDDDDDDDASLSSDSEGAESGASSESNSRESSPEQVEVGLQWLLVLCEFIIGYLCYIYLMHCSM